MMRRIAFAVVVSALLPAEGMAHRLDEYLQASRVAVTPTSIRLELDLTPGANIAASILGRIDIDHDRRVSGHEAETYGRAVLNDVSLLLDQIPLGLRLQHVEVSTPEELLEGVGMVRLVATAPVLSSPARHQLTLRNNHETVRSVYLMNALLPASTDVVITAQSRDKGQQEFVVQYEVRQSASPAWGIMAAIVSLGALGAALCLRSLVGSERLHHINARRTRGGHE